MKKKEIKGMPRLLRMLKMKKEKCPLCKSDKLNHGAEDWSVKGELSIEVGCAKSNCRWIGYVVYKIQFSRVEDLGGNRVE